MSELEHLDPAWFEGSTEDGDDGWDGFFCPRCGTPESSYASVKCFHRPTRADLEKRVRELEALAGVRDGAFEKARRADQLAESVWRFIYQDVLPYEGRWADLVEKYKSYAELSPLAIEKRGAK